MELAKRRDGTGTVHVIDLDDHNRAPCGTPPQWNPPEPEWVDDLSIGCPVCRTFVVDWLLGRGVGRDARQLVQDDVEWRHQQIPTVPRGWGKGHGAS